MDFIGLFKCNFCPSRLHDVESLITHFSTIHLNRELFECESCSIKFWKIPDYYEHRNKSTKTCGGEYGITMSSIFTMIKSLIENSRQIGILSKESPNFIKSELHEQCLMEINVSSQPFESAELITKIENKEQDSTKHIGNSISQGSQKDDNSISNSHTIASDKKIKITKHNNLRVSKRNLKKLPKNTNIKEVICKLEKSEKVREIKDCNKIQQNVIKSRSRSDLVSSLENLVQSQSNGAIENRLDACHVCNKEFIFYSSLATHIYSKHSDELFCPKCDKKFITKENFWTHINEFHKIKKKKQKKVETKKLECLECLAKVFARVNTFVLHLINKHNKSDDEINKILEVNNESFQNDLMCRICGKLFATIDHFIKHQKRKHGEDGSKKYKCKSCQKFFATKDEVKTHTLESHKKKLVCQICNNGKIYACTESLTSHIKKIHSSNTTDQIDNANSDKNSTKVYKFICGQCGKIMYGRTQFKNHEASNCGRNPVHKCHICGKGFASAGTLKGHISIHEDYESYQFVCDFCQKRYRTKHQLEKHRRVHTGERPFQCPHCEKAFGTSAALFVHVSTHTGIKRYMCTCGERFSCITGLKGHWKTNFSSCGSDPNKSTKPVGEYIGYRKGKIVNIRPEDEMMMRPSL